MLLILARAGLIVLTLFYVLWVIFELRHREEIARTIYFEPGVGPVSNFKFGWKLGLAVILGVPALTILWALVS